MPRDVICCFVFSSDLKFEVMPVLIVVAVLEEMVCTIYNL